MIGEVRTLEEFSAAGRTITAFCSHYFVCSHDAQLRLDLLAFHLGWGFDFYGGKTYLSGRLRCSICGWYHPTFALGHAGERNGFAGAHGAGFAALADAETAALRQARLAERAGEQAWVGNRKGGRKFGR